MSTEVVTEFVTPGRKQMVKIIKAPGGDGLLLTAAAKMRTGRAAYEVLRETYGDDAPFMRRTAAELCAFDTGANVDTILAILGEDDKEDSGEECSEDCCETSPVSDAESAFDALDVKVERSTDGELTRIIIEGTTEQLEHVAAEGRRVIELAESAR